MAQTKSYKMIISGSLEKVTKPVSRLAPTPSGYLHVGNALSFMLTWLLIRRLDGFLHLRIDDLDSPRLKTECLEDLFYQLEWLGIDYDKGPSGPDNLKKNYSQVLRISAYEQVLKELRNKRKLYACNCSRKEYMPLSTNGRYPGTCRNLGIPFKKPESCWRIHIPEPCWISPLDKTTLIQTDLATIMGDCILRRRDGQPGYQIASLVDDLDSGCNLIIRGCDLYPSSVFQYYLAKILEHTEFKQVVFLHHPLLTDESGMKLTKSGGSQSLKSLRNQYNDPGYFYRLMAQWLNLKSSSVNSLKELQDAFLDIPLSNLQEKNIQQIDLEQIT